MATHTEHIHLETQGHAQVVDVTGAVADVVAGSGIHDGLAVVFVVGSTAAITTTEAEPGLLNHDLKAFYERIAPEQGRYVHEETWNDDNGHSHVRASSLGPSITVPVIDGGLPLGTWQQIVLIDFDTRGRKRDVIIQVVGD